MNLTLKTANKGSGVIEVDPRTGREVMALRDFPKEDRARFAEAAARPRPPHPWKRIFCGWIPSRAYYEWYAERGRDPFKTKRQRDKIAEWLREAILERDGNLCQLCFEPIEESPHIDHIKPWSHGGPTAFDNLQVAHPVCNMKKGSRVA